MDALYSIGELARRTGLSVKAIRFYADRGIVPPTVRSPAGHRLYDVEAVARLDLVRTLRDLGLDLATIRRVVDHEISLPEVAAAHADALDAQIRTLRLRRAVLTAVAKRGSAPEEMDLMHKLATLSAYERSRLIAEFLDTVFRGLHDRPEFDGIGRSMTPELPDDPAPEQVEAWVELAELTADQEFRAVLHRTATLYAASQGPGLRPDLAAAVRDRVGPLLAAGIGPDSPQAAAVVAEFAGHSDDVVGYLRTVNDARRQRYLELLSVINDWPAPESLAPALDWFLDAARAAANPDDRSSFEG
jgi:DNA-binding transcriptional MerR regulator